MSASFTGGALRLVAGVDEAGRGPLAGPLVAAAVILPPKLSGMETWLKSLNDSKRLTARQREVAFPLIQQNAVAVSVMEESSAEIDRLGIGKAVIRAMLRAVAGLAVKPEFLLLDYVPIKECPYSYETLVKGDGAQLFHRRSFDNRQGNPGPDNGAGGSPIPRLRICPQQGVWNGAAPAPIVQVGPLPAAPALLCPAAAVNIAFGR